MQVRFASTATLAPRGTTDRGQWRVKGDRGTRGPGAQHAIHVLHRPYPEPYPKTTSHTPYTPAKRQQGCLSDMMMSVLGGWSRAATLREKLYTIHHYF